MSTVVTASRSQSGALILRVAWVAVSIVLGLGYAVEVLGLVRGVSSSKLGLDFLRLDSEASLPPLVSAIIMVAIAALCFRTGSRERRLHLPTALGWTVLGAGFVYMSIDEFFAIHEVLLRTREIPNYGGLLTQKWLLVGIPVVIAVGLMYIPFLLRLPRATAKRLAIAGSVFVLGSVGFEAIDGWVLDELGRRSAVYSISTAVEETFEFVGLLLGLRAILRHDGETAPAAIAARPAA